MNIEQMKTYIIKAYPGQMWKDKVSYMSNEQVIAIYFNLMKKEGATIIMPRQHGRTAYQLTFDDILRGELK